MPIEAAGFVPLFALGEFLAHEEEFLAWMRVLIGIEQAEVGELLPEIAGHFVEQGIFAVDDFVVGEGKKKIFGEGVEKGKSKFVVLVLAVDGVVREVFQSVIHPAHIPFETETKAAEISRA